MCTPFGSTGVSFGIAHANGVDSFWTNEPSFCVSWIVSWSPLTVMPATCSPGLPLKSEAPLMNGARKTAPKYDACFGFRSRSSACWNVSAVTGSPVLNLNLPDGTVYV